MYKRKRTTRRIDLLDKPYYMKFHIHTKAIIFNPEGNILVQKRSDTGKWDLIGGKTELPEKIEDAIIREIKEESGIEDIKNLKVIHVESSFSQERNEYFVLVIFTGKTKSSISTISDEHNDYMRTTKDKLLSIGLTEYLQKSLEKIINLF
ncbi:MAG: NUDIX domain-containing protein [candidate division SR1 bacterium]|nr:NUDIX domain-containing protein [candidate division SR1 bacterium]